MIPAADPGTTVTVPSAVADTGGAPPPEEGRRLAVPPAPQEVTWLTLNRGVFLLMVAGLLPLVGIFLVGLWSRPQYQFFPLALAGAAYLARTRFSGAVRPGWPGHEIVTGLLEGVALVVLAMAVLLFSPWLASFAALFWLVGLVWRQSGWGGVRALLPALVLTLAIIPLPLGGDAWMLVQLRSLAVRWSSRVLDLLGVIHLLSGNVIELPQQKLLVEEACSGINSVLLTLAVCLFYLFWRRRAWWWFVVCLPVTLVSVILGNVGRITLGAWLKYQHGVDLLSGWKHELVGLVLLAGYLALIVSLDQLLDFLTYPMWERFEKPSKPGEKSRREAANNPPASAKPKAPAPPPTAARELRAASFWWWALAGVFGALGVVQAGLAWRHFQPLHRLGLASESHLKPGATFTMPETIGSWKRLESGAPLMRKIETTGIFSQIWNYEQNGIVATVALDYPFRGYHDVTVCYTLAGWSLTRQRMVGADTNGSPPCVEVEMQKGSIHHGALWFSTIDEQGRWMERAELARRFLERWTPEGVLEPTSYRIQVLVTGYNPLTAAERVEVQQLFASARSALARQFLDQLQPPTSAPGGVQ